jgi:hypothetical protein
MPPEFLYERITIPRPNSKGTLAEPEGTPEPRFALQGTVNWMHGLSIIVAEDQISYASMRRFYAGTNVQRNVGLTEPAANTAFEQLLMSLHHLSALRAMATANGDDLVLRRILWRQRDDRCAGWLPATRSYGNGKPMGPPVWSAQPCSESVQLSADDIGEGAGRNRARGV